MLKQIRISQFATIEHLEAEFDAGLTVITGETGAGKTVFMDALSLIAGARTNPSMVRAGADRADVSVTFDVQHIVRVTHWLREHGFPQDDGHCTLRRTLSAQGRTRSYVNGVPAAVVQLRELGALLIRLHRQNEHLRLLQHDEQLRLLDAHGGCSDLAAEVAGLFAERREIERRVEALGRQAQGSDRLSLLHYQLEELEAQDLSERMIDDLDAEHDRLLHANRYRELVEQSIHTLGGADDSLVAVLGRQAAELSRIPGGDRLATVRELLETAGDMLADAVRELRSCSDGIAIDPDRLQELDNRIGLLHDLARKHRVSLRALPEHARQLQEERQQLQQASTELDKLHAQGASLQAEYQRKALQLRVRRQVAAQSLGEAVTACFPQLGMKGGCFLVRLTERDERPAQSGLDEVEFEVSGGRFQRPGPLSRVASGGELSRTSLALQLVIASGVELPTLVFDEVDAGVGGRAAGMVGQSLRRLASHAQVLCVTHLPQVAVQGQWHQRLVKKTGADTVITELQQLGGAGRIDEIARMIGGVEITAKTMDVAAEMLENAAGDRKGNAAETMALRSR